MIVWRKNLGHKTCRYEVSVSEKEAELGLSLHVFLMGWEFYVDLLRVCGRRVVDT